MHPEAWCFLARGVGVGVPQGGVTPGLPLGHKGCGLYSFQESVFTKHSFKSLPPAWELRAGTSAERILSVASGWIQENSFFEFSLGHFGISLEFSII